MKIATVMAALLLASATAAPAFANTAAFHTNTVAFHKSVRHERTYRHGAYHPTHRRGVYYPYAFDPRFGGYHAFAAYPRPSGWGHCVSGLDSGAASAFPSWDVCGTN
jgi:hypothetical protein